MSSKDPSLRVALLLGAESWASCLTLPLLVSFLMAYPDETQQDPMESSWKMFERSGHRQPAPNCQAHWYFFFKKNNLYLFIYLLAVQHVGILVPWTGIEPVPSAVAYDIITHWTTKEVPRISISCSGQVLGRPRVRWPEDDIKQSSPLITFVTVRKHPSPMTPFLK